MDNLSSIKFFWTGFFAKVDLLPIDKDRENKEGAKKYKTFPTPQKTADNITLVHFM